MYQTVWAQFFYSPMTIFIFRLVLALLLGSLLGIERIHAHKVAGMRTYGLVTLAAAFFVVIGEVVSLMSTGVTSFSYNPLIMAAAVISGIGFLGAGLIIFQQDRVKNLTTAAGLWVAAAIGVSVGFGLYALAITAVILVIITFTAFKNFEDVLKAKIFDFGPKDIGPQDVEK